VPVYEAVKSPQENLRWPVLPEFAAQGALDGDRLKRKFLPTRGHIAAAPLAGDDEGLAARGSRELGDIIGEYEANMRNVGKASFGIIVIQTSYYC
jgi:hypothetical protein